MVATAPTVLDFHWSKLMNRRSANKEIVLMF